MLSPSLRSMGAVLSVLALLSAAVSRAQTTATTITANPVNLQTVPGAANLVVDNTITISGSTENLTKATVSISAGFQTGDVLGHTGTLPGGITASFSASTGVLTLAGSATPDNYQAALRTVTISLAAGSATTRSVTFTLGELVSYTNGHYYKYVSAPGGISWVDAKAAAAASANKYFGLTGYLATITSAGENEFIRAKLAGDGWIGASDAYDQINAATGVTTYASQAASENNWYWVTGPEKGTKFSTGATAVSGKYQNWNAGEPNNSASNENYAQIYATGGVSPGQWNDLNGTSQNGYVVEYGGLSGDPALNISATRNVKMQATTLTAHNYTGTYNPNAPAVVVDPALTITSIGNITGARVTIASGFHTGDVLAYTGTLPAGVAFGGYSTTTGVLSFSGTAAPSAYQALLRTVTFKSTGGASVNRQITFSLGDQVANTNGHFYQYVTAANVSWSSSKTAAAGMTYNGLQGYLATITSAEENTFITGKLSANGWIGGSDAYDQINAATGTTTYADQAAAEGHWYWVTGPEKGTNFSNGNGGSLTPVAGQYHNWASGEPNNSSGENYAQIYAVGGTIGQWNDLNGTTQPGYVVEFGGLSTDPDVQLSSNSLLVVGFPLPIEGITLSAQATAVKNVLQWQALNEQQVVGYEVARSTDGRNFTPLAAVPSKGDGTYNYQYDDATAGAGIVYYRVKSTDRAGDIFYSNTVRLAGEAPALQVTVFPNPAVDYLTIQRQAATPAGVAIVALDGKEVLQTTITMQRCEINISMLPAGTYFLHLSEGGRETVQKFVKQ